MPQLRIIALAIGAVLTAVLCGTAYAATTVTGLSDNNIQHWRAPAQVLAARAGSKFQQARLIVPWDVALNVGSSDWYSTNAWIQRVAALGKTPLVSFNHRIANCSPSLACIQPDLPTPAMLRAAIHAFRTTAGWTSVTEFTAWNEPNHSVTADEWTSAGAPRTSKQMNPSGNPALAAQYFEQLALECQGSGCTAVAGDFADGQAFGSYPTQYKAYLDSHGISPDVWAVHPYSNVNTATSTWISDFVRLAAGKPVWFSEVGVKYCYENGAGLVPANSQAASALRLSSLMQSYSPARTYYYQLQGTESPASCADGNAARGHWDTGVLGPDGEWRIAAKLLFSETVPRAGPDFSGDGRPDILTLDASGTLNMYRGDGAGGWVTGNAEPIGNGWSQMTSIVQPGDFSGDGKPDVIAVNRAGGVFLYRGNGAGGWVTGNAEPLGSGFAQYQTILAPGDFNGDGKADLIVVRPDGQMFMYRGNGAGSWITGNPEAIGSGFGSARAIVTAGDFNGDRASDVITADAAGTLSMYRGNGAGGWVTGNAEVIGHGWFFGKIAGVGDFSGDGNPDLAAVGASGQLLMYRGNGAGDFITGNGEQIGLGFGQFHLISGPPVS